MNFRSGWKRCIAAVMLAGMAASGLTAYAETAQPGTATQDASGSDYYSLGANSDDIEPGNFTPDDNIYYGSATFYDYYGRL